METCLLGNYGNMMDGRNDSMKGKESQEVKSDDNEPLLNEKSDDLMSASDSDCRSVSDLMSPSTKDRLVILCRRNKKYSNIEISVTVAVSSLSISLNRIEQKKRC